MLFDHPQLAPIARRQGGVASRDQILAAGIPSGVLRSAVRRGEAIELQPGALAPCWTPPSRATEEFAAVLGAGPGAALCSLSALQHYGVWGVPEQVHVCVGHQRRPRLIGVRLHRSRIWTPANLTDIDCIPVTEPIRTVFDTAEILRPRTLRGIVEKMVIDGHVTWTELVDALRPHHGRHGLKRLRPILDFMPADLANFDSKLEADFIHLVEDAGIPLPEHHVVLTTRTRTSRSTSCGGPHHWWSRSTDPITWSPSSAASTAAATAPSR